MIRATGILVLPACCFLIINASTFIEMIFTKTYQNLVALAAISFKTLPTEERLAKLFEYLRQATKMDFVADQPGSELEQYIGRQGALSLKKQLNEALSARKREGEANDRGSKKY